jgi:hypothetical protein
MPFWKQRAKDKGLVLDLNPTNSGTKAWQQKLGCLGRLGGRQIMAGGRFRGSLPSLLFQESTTSRRGLSGATDLVTGPYPTPKLSPATGQLLPTNSHQPSSNHRQPAVTSHQATAPTQLPPANRYQLTANCGKATNLQPTTNADQSAATSHQPTTTNHKPTATSHQPTAIAPDTSRQSPAVRSLLAATSKCHPPPAATYHILAATSHQPTTTSQQPAAIPH